jgi:hypothetical protein
LETPHSSAEVDTDWGVATGGLLHVLSVPLPAKSANDLQLQRAKLPEAVVFANCQGVAHTVSALDEALAE